MGWNFRTKIMFLVAAGLAAGAAVWVNTGSSVVSAQSTTRFTGPTNSQPLALSADELAAGGG